MLFPFTHRAFFAYIFNNYDDHNFAAAAVVITICIRILANGQNDCPKILRTQGLEENPNCTNGQQSLTSQEMNANLWDIMQKILTKGRILGFM